MIVIKQSTRAVRLGFFVALLLVPILNGTSGAADLTWPKHLTGSEASVVLYEPQLETFEEDKLTARAAFSVQNRGEKQPTFGVVWFAARVSTDRDTRIATIERVQVTNIKFSDAKPEQEEKLRTFLENEVKDREYTVPLDRLVAAMDKAEEAMRAASNLNTEPPKILFVTHPAVLVPVDGDPKLLPVPNSKLMRVANTPFLMVYDQELKTYYLRGGEDWLTATELEGPWQGLGTVPDELDALWKEIETQAGEPGSQQEKSKKVELVQGKMPQIIVSTEPAELLVTEGEPLYTPIRGTDLLYVSNTDEAIFLDSKTQEYIVLISGRWFKSKSLAEGPWTYVASKDLPSDFAKIPEGSVKGFVLVHVAGTSQAQEAIHETYIPQTAAIDRKKATTEVVYEGDPNWEKIPDTDLEYAVNTEQTVFREGTRYYAVEQGVWYEASSPHGPWTVCVSPPEQVRDIPPSNPHYNAKYVKVYDSTEDVAYVGYTPGYTGSYVQDGTVVYGTGYRYRGYATPTTYVAYPATYGYSAVYDPYIASWGYQPSYYNPYAWLGAAVASAAVVGLTWAAWDDIWDRHHHHRWYGGGFWGVGGYRYRHVGYYHNAIIYDNWRRGRPGYRRDWERRFWDRPGWRDWDRPDRRPRRAEQVRRMRPEDRRPINLSQRPNLYNRPWNQANLAERPRRPGSRPGELNRPRAEVRRDQRRSRPEQLQAGSSRGSGRERVRREGAASPRRQPARGRAIQNNVFADREGNVFRRTPKGWQQREDGRWSTAGPRTSSTDRAAVRRGGSRAQISSGDRPSRAFDARSLNRDYNQRRRAEVRSRQFQRSNNAPAFSRPSGGGRSRGESWGGSRSGFRGGGQGGGGRAGRSGGGGGGGRGGGGRGGR